MPRRTRTEIELVKLWEDLGTLEFSSFAELGMMVNEYDSSKVKRIVYKMIDEDKLFLDFKKNKWMLDYIPFMEKANGKKRLH